MKKILLASLLLCLLAPITIEAKKKHLGNGVYWELSDDGILTISGNGRMPQFKYNKSPWFKQRKEINKVIIEEGITSIGEYSFNDATNLFSVTISNTVVSIEARAFDGCTQLSSLNIPHSVTTIGPRAFLYCNNLKSIVIPNSVREMGQSWDFGGGAFSHTGLESVVIEEGVTSIDGFAFSGCKKLKDITIPITINRIEEHAFWQCEGIKNITIPTSVNTIGECAFSECSNLISIYIPNSVRSIGKYAFYGCTGLQSLYVPNTVSLIGEDAFGSKTYGNAGYFQGEILAMPSFVMNDFNYRKYGISDESAKAYKNGICRENGEIILSMREGRKATKFSNSVDYYDYYIIEESDSQKGIITADGIWIVPINNLLKGYSDVRLIGGNYIKVKKMNAYGIISSEGREIISTSRGYTSIDYNSSKGTFAFTKPRYTGICDAQGKEISLTKLPPTANDIKVDGGYASAVELMNGSTKYYKVSKGGKYGMTNAEGKVIVPTEMEALESAGTGYLRYKLNGFWGVINYAGKIIIPTDRGYTKVGDYVSFTKRFPYEMAGWKGECDAITGRQISKIKVETPQKQIVKQEPQPNPKDDKDTIIIKHDPIPMQVWKQCEICLGSGKCQACANIVWGSGSSRECLGCGWSRKCQWCAGQGGHYEVEYR